MRPNFLIIGAPKCGTSSLFSWLSRHPQICGTCRKEPFVLMDPDHPLRRRPDIHDVGEAAYDRLFPPEAASALVRMEGTTHSLFQQTARDVVASWSDARVAVVMREPASRVYSSFAYTKNNLARLDPALDFAQYLELVEGRVPLFPRWCRHEGSAYVLEREPDHSNYAEHLAGWYEALGPERVRPVLFEHLKADPQGVLLDLCAWLGLDPELLDCDNLATHNRTESVRWQVLQTAARRLNNRVRLPTSVRSSARRLLARIQGGAPELPSSRDLHALESLRSAYFSANGRLAKLTGLELDAW